MRNDPRIIVISCVKNEEDIIEAFLRHHLALVDGLVILDNGSTDRTAGIIRDIVREFRGKHDVTTLFDPHPSHTQSERMTRLLHEYALAVQRADWVIPLDADEFMVPAVLQGIRNGLLPSDRIVNLRWKNYLPTAFDDSAEINPLHRLHHRRSQEPKTRYKVLIPESVVSMYNGKIEIAMGNHAVTHAGVVIAPYIDDACVLAHYPIRHPQQFATKVLHQLIGFEAMPLRNASWGSHLADAFSLLEKNPDAFFERYLELAHAFDADNVTTERPSFVRDPMIYCGGPLTMTTQVPAHYALASAIRYARALAHALANVDGSS